MFGDYLVIIVLVFQQWPKEKGIISICVRFIASILLRTVPTVLQNMKNWGCKQYFLKYNSTVTWNCFYTYKDDNSISSDGLEYSSFIL